MFSQQANATELIKTFLTFIQLTDLKLIILKNILYTLALLVSFSSFGQTAGEYNNSGIDKAEAKDYYGAISDYNKAIEIDPNHTNAYNNRGNSKAELKDYNGSISDYSKAIELNPNYAQPYNNRALSKNYLKDYNGAISDYNKAIEIDPNYSNA